jgi:hypothetical protein
MFIVSRRSPASVSHFSCGRLIAPGTWPFLKIFGLARVYDDDILFFPDLAADFDGAGRESHFVREESLRLGRVALECISHIPATVEFQYGLQCRPSKKFAARRLSAFLGAESAHDKDNQAYQQHQAKPAAADDGTANVKPAASKQEKQNYHE